jgi:hypothetical protein
MGRITFAIPKRKKPTVTVMVIGGLLITETLGFWHLAKCEIYAADRTDNIVTLPASHGDAFCYLHSTSDHP